MTRRILMTAWLASAAMVAAFGRAAAADAPTSSRTTLEEVVVTGRLHQAPGGGLIKAQTSAKSISTVSSAFIQTQAAVQNAYQYVALAPGALVSTTDPYGLSEQGSLNIHGLGQDELGYVLEGMPLNDIGYYTAYPSQFIDSENIDEISLAQGTADLDSPAIGAAGGLMTITMLDPSLRPGGKVDVSYGSYNTNREFLRFDSGLIGATGVRAFVSYSHTGSDDWHGPGSVNRQHVDFKIVKEWGENRVTLTGTLHDGVTPTYIQPTLSQFQQSGADNNYDSHFTPGDDNYYRLHIGTFRIFYTSAPARLKLSDALTLNVTPYWQYGYGNSPYGANLDQGNDSYEGTSGPFALSIPNFANTGGTVMANYTDLQYRAGVVAKLTYQAGPNSLLGGLWSDYADETDVQSYSTLGNTGEPPDLWAESGAGLIRRPNGQLFLAGQDHVITKVEEVFIADVLHLMDDKLTLEAGFKYAYISRDGTNGIPIPAAQYRTTIDNYESLPRASVRYQLDAASQLFATISTNFRTPSEATLFAAYAGGSIYAAANANLKPEYSISEDVGYRYNGALFTGAVSVFNYNFSNRQIATLFGVNNINESINAGGQTTRGLDVELGARPWRHISPYLSAEYLHSVDDSDLAYGTTYLPTAGKTAIRSPKYQAALGLNYDDGVFFGNFNVKYVDSQYATFVNDESIPSYTTANLSFGARLPSAGLTARPELKINLINLTGQNYLAAVGNPTANAQTAIARDGTSVAGSAPNYYLAGGFAAVFTASQAF